MVTGLYEDREKLINKRDEYYIKLITFFKKMELRKLRGFHVVVAKSNLSVAVSINKYPVGSPYPVSTLSCSVVVVPLVVVDKVLLPSLASCELDGSHDGILSRLSEIPSIRDH